MAQIEAGGRVTLPKEILSSLHLNEGDNVQIEGGSFEDASTFTVQALSEGCLVDEAGLLVWKSPDSKVENLDRKVLEAIRLERDLRALSLYAETLD